MKYVLATLLGLLAAVPAFACPPQAAFVTGGYAYALPQRQRTVYREVAADPTPADYCPAPAQLQREPMNYAPETVRERVIERDVIQPPVRERIVYRDVVRDVAPAYDPCPQASFAPSYSYGVRRSFGRQATFQRDFALSYGGEESFQRDFVPAYGVSRQHSFVGQRFLVPAPAFAERTVTRSRTVTRRTLLP